jgi:hypothetical protein
MKWLEVIELRSMGNKRAVIESHLQDLIDEMIQEARQQKIKAYSHVTVETDFNIHLYHDSKRADINGSPLGLRLASALKEFGLVNHSVWVEMH